MRTTLILLVIVQIAASGSATEKAIPTCNEMKLRPEIAQRVVPILKARLKAQEQNDWYLPEYTEPLHQLFREESDIAMEARIALLAYYIGEAYGEELFCAISQDGEEALPILTRYKACRPATVLDPTITNLVLGTTDYELVAEFIREGQSCDLHE